ncbi:MAG: hypothetical protein V3R15_02650 [Qipengyuania citrea]
MATDTIPACERAANSLNIAHDMEHPLGRLHDVLTGIMYAASAMNDGASIATLAEIARDECEGVQATWNTLFDDLKGAKEAAQ